MTIKTVTLENGKEYRVTVRKNSIDVSVKTCRVHHEVSLPTYMTVTGKHVVAKVMAALVESDHAEALAMNEEMDRRHVDSVAYSAQSAFEALDLFAQWNVVDAAHSEALAMNDAFDRSFHRRAANWGAMDSMSRWIEIEKAEALAHSMNWQIDFYAQPDHKQAFQVASHHAVALEMNDDFNHAQSMKAMKESAISCDCEVARQSFEEKTAQNQASTQTVARRNSLSHKIGLAFAGAALLFSGMTHAEVVPSYPVDASRMSLEGSVAVSIDCDAKKVDVLRESTTAAYFSKQVKKQVWNICYGQSGTLDRVYTFVMNKAVGAHDMLVNNSDRHPL